MPSVSCLSAYSNPVDDYSHLTRELGIELAQHHTGCRQQRRFWNHMCLISSSALQNPGDHRPPARQLGQILTSNTIALPLSVLHTEFSNLDSLKGSAVTKKGRRCWKALEKSTLHLRYNCSKKCFYYNISPREKRIYVRYYRILTIYIEFIYSSNIILICS